MNDRSGTAAYGHICWTVKNPSIFVTFSRKTSHALLLERITHSSLPWLSFYLYFSSPGLPREFLPCRHESSCMSPHNPKSYAGGSQTGLKVEARQSRIMTLLPCRMTGDSQRLREKIRERCVLKADVLGPSGERDIYTKNYSTTQLSLAHKFSW